MEMHVQSGDRRLIPANQERRPTVNVAAIGCGRRFREHVIPVIAANGFARITRLVDPSNDSVRRSLLALSQLTPTNSPPPLRLQHYSKIRSPEVDAIVICSPNALHFEHANFGLRQGLRVYVEKPMACNPTEAELLIQESNSRLTVCVERPFRNDLKRVRRWLRDGKFGRLESIHYTDAIQQSSDFLVSWRNDESLAGGGVLIDLGYHTFYTLQWLFPQLDLASEPCEIKMDYGEFRVEKKVLVSWPHCQGVEVKADIQLTTTPSSSSELLEIRGDAAWLRLERRRNHLPNQVELCWQALPNGRIEKEIVFLDGSHETTLLNGFLNQQSRTTKTDLLDHYNTLKMINSAYSAYSATRETLAGHLHQRQDVLEK